LDCIDKALFKRGDGQLLWNTKRLDGDVFFEAALDNKNRHEDQIQAQQVKKALCALRNAANKQLEANNQPKLEPVSPFYAVLMMDGDSLGVQMSDPAKQIAISNSLNAFTNGVKGVVEEHSGFLIYAGGDDVLALLPLEYALNCAYQLRDLYLKSFLEKGGYTKADGTQDKVKSTLSGAIEYAHIKMPLGKVLGDAHHLLDDVAKNTCGRDSIAVRVWKSGGQHLQWAMPWKKAVENDKVIIDELVKDFQKTEQETPFSNSFFFNIEARFAMLQTKNDKGELVLAEGFDPDNAIKKLIAAEYLNSGVNAKRKKEDKITLAQAEERIAPLITQCTPVKRLFEQGKDGAEDKETFIFLNQLNVDAAHFIRFLVSKGVEHG
jgi:CRISPR-associated protein Cmr2